MPAPGLRGRCRAPLEREATRGRVEGGNAEPSTLHLPIPVIRPRIALDLLTAYQEGLRASPRQPHPSIYAPQSAAAAVPHPHPAPGQIARHPAAG